MCQTPIDVSFEGFTVCVFIDVTLFILTDFLFKNFRGLHSFTVTERKTGIRYYAHTEREDPVSSA